MQNSSAAANPQGAGKGNIRPGSVSREPLSKFKSSLTNANHLTLQPEEAPGCVRASLGLGEDTGLHVNTLPVLLPRMQSGKPCARAGTCAAPPMGNVHHGQRHRHAVAARGRCFRGTGFLLG